MSVIYVASDQARAGKTAISVSLARKLSQEGRNVALFKPYSLAGQWTEVDHDGQILRKASGATTGDDVQWPVALASGQEVSDPSLEQALEAFSRVSAGADVTIVEGVGGLDDSTGAVSQQLAERMDARVLVVLGYSHGMDSSEATRARQLFGDRLAGVIINGVTRYKGRDVAEELLPAMQSDGVKVLGDIPEDRRLLGVSVGQLAEHLGGSFLCWEEKKDRLVEHLLIGGLVLDWGVLYFERFDNKAVIVRGSRPDIQMAALGTPTSCIVLTGGEPPIQYVEYEAQEEEVPLIQVETDTLSTAAALETIQGRALFDHPLKQERFLELLTQHGNWDAINRALGL
ncbi:MAG: phosphotransacetylase family protein [Chloroflexi bacterium]|nr:phosphotransacetylase family protein [Chloroflexota bacterium]